MVEGVVGTGAEGKRLWVRTPDNRWIPVPTGAGEDSTVRSVNVWNGTAWEAATDATPLNASAAIQSHLHSLDIYAPTTTWKPGIYNPNYVGTFPSNPPWTPAHLNWIRLFHTAPRVDPNWRIVQLYNRYPPRSRSAGPQPGNHMFFPRGASYFQDRHDEPNGTGGFYSVSSSATTPLSFRVLSGSDLPYELWAETTAVLSDTAKPDDPQFGITTKSGGEQYRAGLLDLRAIRQRLIRDFPQRDPYFNRQFSPMQNMTLKRVILHGVLDISGSASGSSPQIPPPAGYVYANLNDPGVALQDSTGNEGWPSGPSTVRRPTSTAAAGSILVASCTSYDSITTLNANPNDPSTVTSAGLGGTEVNYTFENPGEDNIVFTANTPGMTVGFHSKIQSWHSTFYILDMALHYATSGHDVPAEYRSAKDNGYPVTY